jgi:site-specific DNA-methyltransferase (adenine-specific)
MSAPGPVRSAVTTRDNWETPASLFEPLDREFRFTLDAAASPENAKAGTFLAGPCSFTEGCRCGLCADWLRQVVWINPPYGGGLLLWCEKFANAVKRSATVVALLPSNTDTAWFAHVFEHAAELRFLTGRVNFVGSTSGNTGGNVVAIYRPTVKGLRTGWPVMTLWDWRK